MTFDRARLEALNADHHRRMAQAPSSPSNASRDDQSRAKIIAAIHGCRSRHKMPWKSDGRPQALELGAGYAGDRRTLVEEFGVQYTGIEAVEHVAQAANRSIPEDELDGDGQVLVHHMAIEELPQEWSGRFHLVYSRHVMEHVLDVGLALANIKRVLAPDGIVAAVTPHYFPDPEPAHVTQLRREEWMREYHAAGLKSVYATLESFACDEAHILLVHNDWPLQP
jgi:SAM-dependent methyltransferase